MNKWSRRETIATIAAPASAGLAYFAALYMQQPSLFSRTPIGELLIQPIYFTVMAAPISYLTMFLLALPSYLLLRRWSWNKPWLVLLLGGFLGLLVNQIFSPMQLDEFTLPFVFCGFVVSGVAMGISFGKLAFRFSSNSKPISFEEN